MERVNIKYLEFGSYVDICGLAGLMIGFVVMPISLVVLLLNIIKPDMFHVGYGVLFTILIPLMYYVKGIVVGAITYIPYKYFMKYKGGMTLKYFVD